MTPNRLRRVLLALALILPLQALGAQYTRAPAPSSVPGGNSAGLGLSYVTYLSGEALFRSADFDEWAALTPNLSLRVGDRLWAGIGSKIEVRLPDGATAWLNHESALDLVRLDRGPRGDTIQLALASGEGYFDVKRFSAPDSVLQVDLPGASLRAFGAARFRANTLPDGSAQIGVVSGSVDLEIPDGITTVLAGQFAEMRTDGRVAIDFLPPFDEWDAWVRSRADLYDRPAASARYLPTEMYPYAHEFDTAGRWVAQDPYGTVWVPAVEAGWSPYSNGRWVWAGRDYVWLSYDPWYAPFHYGRWNFSVSLGWFWIAPRKAHWSPGYVAWSVTDDDVCWVPLGHGEVYYGYGNYGPNSVNVYTTTRIRVTNVYVNSGVRNGVIVVRRDNFLRGRNVRERIVETRNPFIRRDRDGATIIGRPPVQEIRPTRETRMPRPEAEVVRGSRPPERVEREFHVIRQRPAVKERGRSVFAPDRNPRPLRNVEKEHGVDQAPPPTERRGGGRPEPAAPPERPRKMSPAAPETPAPEPQRRPEPEQRKAQPPERQKPEREAPQTPETQRPAGGRQEQTAPPERPRKTGPVVPEAPAPEPQRKPEPEPRRAPPPERQKPERESPQAPETRRPAGGRPEQAASPERPRQGAPVTPETPAGSRPFRRVPEPSDSETAAPEPNVRQDEASQPPQRQREPRGRQPREEQRGR